MNVNLNKDVLYPFLIYSDAFQYNNSITLYPVKMKNVLEFQLFSQAITVRKDSRFSDKKIIKMSYLDFIVYTAKNPEIGKIYEMDDLCYYFGYTLHLLQLVCKDQPVTYTDKSGTIFINGFEITPEIFDDLRRIIIIQNDIDFDIDEFLNYDTEKRLQKAQNDISRIKDKATLEDYIDSLMVALHLTEDEVKNMSIRKFWRFIKRFNLHENYTICKTGEAGGMVTYKEPIKHWMVSIDEDDKYSNLKTNEKNLKDKIAGANS